MAFRFWTWCPREWNEGTGQWYDRSGWSWIQTSFEPKGKGKGKK